MLRRYLDLGDAPVQGGERPHVTVTIDLQDLRNGVGAATLEHGGPISAGEARMLACDARIIPAVLGGASQVLDVGAASRSFPAAIRRAITLRDRGCCLARVRPQRRLVRLAPHRALGERWTQQLRERLPALPFPSRRDPSWPLAGPDGPRRCPRIHPTEMG